MVKVVVPLALVIFVGVSFFFLDGWPFRRTPKEASSALEAKDQRAKDQPSNGSEASHRVDDQETARSDDPKKNAKQDAAAPDRKTPVPAELRRQTENALLAAKADPDSYRKALSDAVLDLRLERDFRDELLGDLRKLNEKLIFTAEPTKRYAPWTVQKNDNLTKIAAATNKKNDTNVTPAFLMKVNRLSKPVIMPGQVINVPIQKMAVRVHKDDFRLFVLLGGVICLDYPVGIGKDDGTPEGEFTIRGKTKNPNWTTPEGKVLKFGDPGHIIGSRWLGFDNAAGRTTYGIHGTTDESSVGKSLSAGCVRLKKADLEELFEIVPEGCPVVVK